MYTRRVFGDKIPTLYKDPYTFFFSSIRKKCFEQKLNQQISNAIIGLFTYKILIVKSGYIIDMNV